MKQVRAPVISNTEVIPEGHLIWLDSAEIASEAKAGQFVMVRCGEETLLRRPLSIHQRDGDRIALLVNVVAKGTRWLSQVEVGDDIDLLGPLGNGFSVDSASKKLLLVAGGIGIAPLRFLADEALKQEKNVTLLLGAPTAARLYPGNLLPGGVELIIATEDGSAGRKGMVTDLLPDFAGGADGVFACGPVPMYRTMAEMPELKNKPVQISLEVRMGCGRGICYGCTLKTRNGLKQVCADGPVLDLDDILWDELDY